MKSVIRDANALKRLSPVEVADYLRWTGWRQQEVVADKWATWVKDDAHEILLPLKQEFRDFALRMSEVLQELEQVEDRSPWMIFNDLQTTDVDRIRVGFVGQGRDDGSLSLDEYVAIAKDSRAMMCAAACGVVEPKAVLPNAYPEQVIDYLRGVRIGRSERGDLLRIQSPVPPLPSPLQDGLEREEPFSRQVVMGLFHALQEMRHLAEHLDAEPSQCLEDAVKKGVSANLCEAVVGLAGDHAEHPHRLAFSFFLSRSAPVPHTMPSSVSFEPDTIPWIKHVLSLLLAKGADEASPWRGQGQLIHFRPAA